MPQRNISRTLALCLGVLVLSFLIIGLVPLAWQASAQIAVGPVAPINGRGTTNYLAKFTAANTIGNSQFFDNGTSVGIGTTSPQGALDVVSTAGGFIVPRMTTAQRNKLTPVNGMIIYNTDNNQFNFRENGAWVLK